MPSFLLVIQDVESELYSQVGGAQPCELTVALLECAGVSEIVIVVFTVKFSGDGIAINIWVVLGQEESQSGWKFKTNGSFVVESHGISV